MGELEKFKLLYLFLTAIIELTTKSIEIPQAII